MLTAVNGYYDGSNIVLTENVSLRKGQRAIIIFPDDDQPEETTVVSDEELDAVSEMLIERNREAYGELAK
jgi:enhancing lycopene biosynthesis protein 2